MIGVVVKAGRLLKNIPILGALTLDLWRIFSNPGDTWLVLLDLKNTWKEAEFLRKLNVVSDDRLALVLTVTDDSIYRLKLEAMLAFGLKLKGWHPVVVLDSRARIQARRYFRAFGIRNFIYLDDIKLDAADIARCKAEAKKFLSQKLDLQTVKKWDFNGSWIGPQIISTLSRLIFKGMPDLQDPRAHKILELLLPRILGQVLKAHKLVDLYRPLLAIVNEANYTTFGPLVDICVAHDIDVIQFIQPWRDDALVFRRLTKETRRDHPGAVSEDTMEKLSKQLWDEEKDSQLRKIFSDRYNGKWFLQSRNQKNVKSLSKDDLVRELKLNPNRKTAVVFSHVLWDGNLFYGEDLFKDYGDWFIQTVKAACQNTDLNWIIKLHPANVWKRSYEQVTEEYAEVILIRDEIGDLPDHVKLIPADTSINTYSLFESIDYGVTVRGTPGMELPCFGVPCVTAGTGRYSGLGFTVDSNSIDEYLGCLSTLHELAPLSEEEKQRAQWHAYASFMLRPWIMDSFLSKFSFKESGSHALDHNLVFNVKSITDINRNGDINRWGEWAENSTVDYLEETGKLISINENNND